MKRSVLVVILVIFGIKYGIGYIFSPKFQEYGDRTKAPWTCEVNNFIGHMLMVFSRYDNAMEFFQYTLKRCPEGAKAEVAEFEVAECLANSGRNREASDAYRLYFEKYKGTKRAKIAERAADLLRVN